MELAKMGIKKPSFKRNGTTDKLNDRSSSGSDIHLDPEKNDV